MSQPKSTLVTCNTHKRRNAPAKINSFDMRRPKTTDWWVPFGAPLLREIQNQNGFADRVCFQAEQTVFCDTSQSKPVVGSILGCVKLPNFNGCLNRFALLASTVTDLFHTNHEKNHMRINGGRQKSTTVSHFDLKTLMRIPMRTRG